MKTRFLQMHALTDYSAVLLNRDENDAAKRLLKGGLIRTRVASQCLKRHMRDDRGIFALSNISADPVRTRELAERAILKEVRERLTDLDEDTVQAAIAQLNVGLYGPNGQDEKKRQALLFGRPEIEWLVNIVCEKLEDAKGPKEAADAIASIFSSVNGRKNFSAFRASQAMPAGIIGASFGRMDTADNRAKIDGAVHVAHAFTVHDEESEIDFFTAMEELQYTHESGASLMSHTEINSGIFYLYICVDIPSLVSNTTGCAPEDWEDADHTIAAQTCANLAGLLATVSPGAKKGSTAPYAYAQALLAELGERQPRSLAGAFTEPSQPNMRDAVRKLAEHLSQCDRVYGPHEARLQTGPDDNVTLTQLHSWIESSVLKGEAE